jgi:ABC-type lipoprotein export system ATPase subunit
VKNNNDMINLQKAENLPTLKEFKITGLFGELEHTISFPPPVSQASKPEILILVGRNGIGKTTILNMLSGLLTLNFDPFRRVPFTFCQLTLSNGDSFTVKNDPQSLLINFNDWQARINVESTDSEILEIETLREAAAPVLNGIHFELVNIHRLIGFLQNEEQLSSDKSRHRAERNGIAHYELDLFELSNLVQQFIREAQINYRKYFAADDLDFLPRLLNRFSSTNGTKVETKDLLTRLDNIRAREPVMKRLGLAIDSHDLELLTQWLRDTGNMTIGTQTQAALEAYMEMLENKNEVRERIATRLLRFEAIMDEFLIGKKVRLDAYQGLKIETTHGNEIKEIQFSSGEYHFIYMMITALVSHSFGTIIAIDEPELSLHVSWQRQLIRALQECASGASPLFLFATHSSAIGAEFQDKWVSLS